jgi:hypothetical protein
MLQTSRRNRLLFWVASVWVLTVGYLGYTGYLQRVAPTTTPAVTDARKAVDESWWVWGGIGLVAILLGVGTFMWWKINNAPHFSYLSYLETEREFNSFLPRMRKELRTMRKKNG